MPRRPLQRQFPGRVLLDRRHRNPRRERRAIRTCRDDTRGGDRHQLSGPTHGGQAPVAGPTNQRLMELGVWMLDPDRTYVDDTVTVEPGAKIYPGVHLEGNTTVAGRSPGRT